MSESIESRIGKLEVNIEYIKSTLDELRNMLHDSATKQYVKDVVETHGVMCPVRKEYLSKEEAYSVWLNCMSKYLAEKESRINRLAVFVKSVLYLFGLISSAAVLFTAAYYFFFRQIGG